MKLEERKQNSFIQKSIFLLIIMTLWICLGTGFTVNAAQREDTKLLKIYDGKSIEASQIQFKAEVATPDSNRIDIYRSEKPVSQGGKLEKDAADSMGRSRKCRCPCCRCGALFSRKGQNGFPAPASSRPKKARACWMVRSQKRHSWA